MLSVVGEWIKNRCLTSELVEFLEFVSTVGINNQEFVRLSVQVALNIRPRFGPKQNGFRIHLASGRTNGASRRLVPPMSWCRFTRHEAEKRQGNRLTWPLGGAQRMSIENPLWGAPRIHHWLRSALWRTAQAWVCGRAVERRQIHGQRREPPSHRRPGPQKPGLDRINARRSVSIWGRPPRGRDFQRQ